MWLQQTLAAATRSSDSKLDVCALMVNIVPTANKQKKHNNNTQQVFSKRTELLPLPQAIFIMLCSAVWLVCGNYLRLFSSHVLWLCNNEKNGARGYATVGTKHIYQREILQLDIFNFKCFMFFFSLTVRVCWILENYMGGTTWLRTLINETDLSNHGEETVCQSVVWVSWVGLFRPWIE